MSLFIKITVITFIGLFNVNNSNAGNVQINDLDIEFKEANQRFTLSEKQLATNLLIESEIEVRKLLPNLPMGIKVVMEIVDWDLEVVGGVTGRAETNTPPLILLQISNRYPGGIEAALRKGLRSTFYHELHHLALGWAIQDNRYTPDIQTATVIEGLAEVFAEEYTGVDFEENQMPQDVHAEDWVAEILALPKDADYQTWMFQHPDGRTSIGYRTGNYLVKKAMTRSGKTILDLSTLTPHTIIQLAGY